MSDGPILDVMIDGASGGRGPLYLQQHEILALTRALAALRAARTAEAPNGYDIVPKEVANRGRLASRPDHEVVPGDIAKLGRARNEVLDRAAALIEADRYSSFGFGDALMALTHAVDAEAGVEQRAVADGKGGASASMSAGDSHLKDDASPPAEAGVDRP